MSIYEILQLRQHLPNSFFCFLVLHATADSLGLDNWGTDISVGSRLLSGETLLQAKNSTGRWWDSNPGPYREHSHCRKHLKLLRHLDLLEKLWKY